MSVQNSGSMDEEEFERRLQNLRDFDLTPVTERLKYKKGMENAEELEKKFKKFAKLHLERPDEHISPSRELDKYWHEFILDTYRYHRFCDEVFGEYLHHAPGDPKDRDWEAYAERVSEGETHESDAFCHARIGDEETK